MVDQMRLEQAKAVFAIFAPRVTITYAIADRQRRLVAAVVGRFGPDPLRISARVCLPVWTVWRRLGELGYAVERPVVERTARMKRKAEGVTA